METAPEIVLPDGVDREKVRTDVLERLAALERFHPRITRGRVSIEQETQRHQSGNLYTIKIELHVPGAVVAVTRSAPHHKPHEDLDVALRDAFHAARRRLEDTVRERRGDVKAHAPPAHAVIEQLLPSQDCGFLRTPSGRQVYFHRNSVAQDRFDTLTLGQQVTFHEEMGEKGAQATRVTPVGRHHHYTDLPR